MVKNGYFSLGNIAGVHVLIHLTAPLGAWFFSGFEFIPAAWFGFFVLILLHELGHAWMVKRVGATVRQVEILPFGGTCSWTGHATPFEEACIAFAGIWMQLVIFILASLFVAFYPGSLSKNVQQFLSVMTTTNLLLMGFNMLPVAPLDGFKAWRFFPLAYKKLKLRRVQKRLKRITIQDLLDS